MNGAQGFQEKWQDHFKSVEYGWLDTIRKENITAFMNQGFPSTLDEEWKYTNLSSLVNEQFDFAKNPSAIAKHEVEKFYLSGDYNRLVFVDGFYQEKLSHMHELPEGVVVTNLMSGLTKYEKLIQKYLPQKSANVFSNLNTACMSDGAFVYIPANVCSNTPLHLLFITSNSQTSSMNNVRNLIVMDHHAQLTLLEDYQSLDTSARFSNTVTQYCVGPEARIHCYKLQNQNRESFHISNVEVTLKKNGRFNFHNYHLGGKLVREDIHCYLEEPGSHSEMQGLYLPLQHQHIDIHTYTHHLVENTSSEQLFKGIVGKKSCAVFNGKITVNKAAQRTAANLKNQNLLLSKDASVNTKPELIIHADDVKCTHGATIGQLDAEMLFYLRSRGVTAQAAYQMLLMAFMNENLEKMPHPSIATKISNCIKQFCDEEFSYE